MSDRVGQQLGNYRLERLLAQGSFGDVYLGEHIHLGTQAAIKVLNAQIVNEDVGQFRTEARMIARLIHPNIVRILEFGLEGSTPFLVMDYAPNGTLRQLHPKGSQVPLTKIVSYVNQIAGALQYAHENKLIHRDVKPENMLVGRHGELLLSDFGIALIVQSSRYQPIQDMAGTITYMAPEQIQAHPRPASDQYALGVVVYEWLSGVRPFHGSFTEIAVKHAAAPPPSLREKIPMISPVVEHVVMTALAKDPQQRFSSVQAFAKALEEASQDGLETVFSVKSEIQSSPPLSQMFPVKETRPEEIEAAISASKVVETEHGVDEPNRKRITTANNDKIVWTISIRRPRLSSILPPLLGIILFGLLTSLLDPVFFALFVKLSIGNGSASGLFDTLGALFLFGLVEAVPLFFGAVFGSAVGSITGALGFLVGTYGSYHIYGYPSYFDYFDFFIRNGLLVLMQYMAIIGFVPGFTVPRTQRRYHLPQSLILVYIFSLVGVTIGVSITLVCFDFIVLHVGLAWQQILLLIVVFPGLTLVPILLRVYDAIIERIPDRWRASLYKSAV